MFTNLYQLNLKWIIRDRVLQALVGVALLLLVLVPAFSVLSMRQVQELSITLSLSFISFVLALLAILLGASSVWRDIEKRYTSAVLTLPYSRGSYLLGKFFAIAVCLVCSAAIFTLVAAVAISFSSGLYQSSLPIRWLHIFTAVAFDVLKYVLLVAIAILFSSISTSFFLPIFGTISLLLAGNASQEVFEYLTKDSVGVKTAKPLLYAAKGIYYLIPNLGAFNFKVSAIYPVALSSQGVIYTLLYFLVYTTIILYLAVYFFSRREFP
ncbi:MAG: ABC transporter permease subunit [Geobacteraceae bacterium]|nr:ABC transporter permease subunit [Geobacteraceae bacterium]